MDNPTNDFLDIRDRIFELLKESGMSQKEFALRIEVSPQTITDWKKGKSSSFSRMLSTIALGLNASPAWLVFGSGEKYMSRSESLRLLKSQISHDVAAIRESMEDFASLAPEAAKLSLVAMAVASAYDKADEGTQASIRKLLDIDLPFRESMDGENAMQFIPIIDSSPGLKGSGT